MFRHSRLRYLKSKHFSDALPLILGLQRFDGSLQIDIFSKTQLPHPMPLPLHVVDLTTHPLALKPFADSPCRELGLPTTCIRIGSAGRINWPPAGVGKIYGRGGPVAGVFGASACVEGKGHWCEGASACPSMHARPQLQHMLHHGGYVGWC